MNLSIPLGKREEQRLEFKSSALLEKPESIARAAVAMLNAGGGDVWIGLEERDGIAMVGQPIEQPSFQERRLQDYLIDTIEPSATREEIAIHQVPLGLGGSSLLLLRMRPREDRTPYAFLKQGGRHFVIRVGDRVRPMSREEIVGPAGKPGNRVEDTIDKLNKRRIALQAEGGQFFWLLLAPAAESELEIDIQSDELRRLLNEPQLSGNRLSGWNFSKSNWEPRLRKDGLVTSGREDRYVEIKRDGWMTFRLPLERLHWKGDAHELWPFALLEFPISAMRLASKVYGGKLHPGDKLVADLMLLGLNGWSLRPDERGSHYFFNPPMKFEDGADLVWDKPLLFGAEELANAPDRCGVRLVERVYEAFGLRREAIPREFDQAAGRLVFPE